MKIKLYIVIILAAAVSIFANTASAYWLWTPETKKFVNPKHAVKDSPKEQFDWAMSFYDSKDYKKAASEFEKLVKNYEYSEYASKAQYYAGLCYENMGKYYIAFQNYQKTIDNYPQIENLEEIIAREFNIGNIYESKDNPKVLGTDIMTSLDRSVEIYRKVVDDAPYGRLADEAQFRLGEALKRSERYDEAIVAFQRIGDDYPDSKFAERAQYETAHCAYMASLKPAYDLEPTDKAIRAFEEFSNKNRDEELSREAEKTIQRLKDKNAEKSLMTARFYERLKRYPSAIIYYQDIVDRFPESYFVEEARAKIESLNMKVKK
ncbi:MAG: tetratricopeptide repeat protein [Candidatus Omnitrophica bacterium]|nr:tetratricopeptide repeat protein [Candidatus Omnitrophota bacterium]